MKWIYLTLIFFIPFITAKGQTKESAHSSKNNVIITDLNSLDKKPMFPGGDKAYGRFLNKNLKWPSPDDVNGRVIISFIIEKDGALTGFKVERSIRKDFDAEALRVLKKSPKWILGRQDGKLVRVKYLVPINFQLSN